MLCWRPEQVALLLCSGVALLGVQVASEISAAAGAGSGSSQQLELKLSALRVHKQLLQAELGRIYMEAFTPETPLLLEELQRRQQEIEQQIETLEALRSGNKVQQDAQQLALNLAADFQFLQHKLDELKQQLDALQPNSNGSSTGTAKQPLELQRDVINSTPKTPVSAGSYFLTPLLAMPELPGAGIAQPPDHSSPSLIKRLLAMLRPGGSSTTPTTSLVSSSFRRGGHWPDQGAGKNIQLLSAEELLPQLQLQRQFLDDAIKRLERLAAKPNDKF
ncbi:uncharacterized protein [Drosophila virilis]|uniref:Uncharacterized protein n=1 Tax=Drosophila virilis TaxID=7244 RepID=B4M7F2_DROVI|nr:uncharacterized protein Dvir_GJ16461 [Drosophila virilis]